MSEGRSFLSIGPFKRDSDQIMPGAFGCFVCEFQMRASVSQPGKHQADKEQEFVDTVMHFGVYLLIMAIVVEIPLHMVL